MTRVKLCYGQSIQLNTAKKLTILACAFLASLLLVIYLDGKLFYLPQWLRPSGNDGSLLTLSTSPERPAVVTDSYWGAKPESSVNAQASVSELFEVSVESAGCVDHSLGELKLQKKNGLFYWIDKQGVKHISDKKPREYAYQDFPLAGEQIFDYFSLYISGSDVPFQFKENLDRTITKLFSVYGQLISKAELKKVAVNLQFIASKKEFEAYKSKNEVTNQNSVGFYNNGTNQAVIYYRDYASAFATALHETSHAINRAVLGKTNKWFNEGLAEYLEKIEINLASVQIKPHPDWVNNGKLHSQPIPIARLFSGNLNDWNGPDSSAHYESSWSLIYFLMDDPARKRALANYMRHEQQNLCDELSVQQLTTDLDMNISSLQLNFNNWLKAKKFQTHRI